MADPPEGPRKGGLLSEYQHHERSHSEDRYAASEEACASSALRGVTIDVPLGHRHRRGVAAVGVSVLSYRAFSFREDDAGVISSHIRVTELLVLENLWLSSSSRWRGCSE